MSSFPSFWTSFLLLLTPPAPPYHFLDWLPTLLLTPFCSHRIPFPPPSPLIFLLLLGLYFALLPLLHLVALPPCLLVWPFILTPLLLLLPSHSSYPLSFLLPPLPSLFLRLFCLSPPQCHLPFPFLPLQPFILPSILLFFLFSTLSFSSLTKLFFLYILFFVLWGPYSTSSVLFCFIFLNVVIWMDTILVSVVFYSYSCVCFVLFSFHLYHSHPFCFCSTTSPPPLSLLSPLWFILFYFFACFYFFINLPMHAAAW